MSNQQENMPNEEEMNDNDLLFIVNRTSSKEQIETILNQVGRRWRDYIREILRSLEEDEEKKKLIEAAGYVKKFEGGIALRTLEGSVIEYKAAHDNEGNLLEAVSYKTENNSGKKPEYKDVKNIVRVSIMRGWDKIDINAQKNEYKDMAYYAAAEFNQEAYEKHLAANKSPESFKPVITIGNYTPDENSDLYKAVAAMPFMTREPLKEGIKDTIEGYVPPVEPKEDIGDILDGYTPPAVEQKIESDATMDDSEELLSEAERLALSAPMVYDADEAEDDTSPEGIEKSFSEIPEPSARIVNQDVLNRNASEEPKESTPAGLSRRLSRDSDEILVPEISQEEMTALLANIDMSNDVLEEDTSPEGIEKSFNEISTPAVKEAKPVLTGLSKKFEDVSQYPISCPLSHEACPNAGKEIRKPQGLTPRNS